MAAVRAELVLVAILMSPLVATAGPAEPYRIGPGDALAISVYGDAGLSGDFSVDSDGTISLPLLGGVVVLGKSLEDVRLAVTAGLTPYVPSPAVTVRIASYAPVYVVGEVDTPGEYPFRPGMTTLQLVARAGGLRHAAADPADSVLLRTIALEGEYSEMALRRYAQEVQVARLQAELDGTGFEYPTTTAQAGVDLVASRLAIENERRLFELRRDGLQSSDTGIAAQIDGFVQEIATLKENAKLYEDELGLLSEDVEAQRALVERSVSTPARLREVLREQSATRRDALELQATLAQAQQGKLEAERRRAELHQAFRTDAAAQLRETELEIASLRQRMTSQLKTMAALRDEDHTSVDPESAATPAYAIVRSTGLDTRQVSVDENTEVLPGDLLRVTIDRSVIETGQKPQG